MNEKKLKIKPFYVKCTLSRREFFNGEKSYAAIAEFKNSNRLFFKRRVIVDENLEGLASQFLYLGFRINQRDDIKTLEKPEEEKEKLWVDYPITLEELDSFYSFYTSLKNNNK
ncbi:MAG: hypothetical protein KatS3mg001_133 [Candidatus Pacearchaeota archaeon]|nr:MAG: hypothetical protein KatS3mg001_133 [Candidatus Pacearchaeota archaeon]